MNLKNTIEQRVAMLSAQKEKIGMVHIIYVE